MGLYGLLLHKRGSSAAAFFAPFMGFMGGLEGWLSSPYYYNQIDAIYTNFHVFPVHTTHGMCCGCAAELQGWTCCVNQLHVLDVLF